MPPPGREAARGSHMVGRLQLDAEIVAAEFLRRDERRAGAAEGVEHQPPGGLNAAMSGFSASTGFWVG